ncbi:6-phosphogluconolactonase [Leptospira idonii]|uniref:6-phosphogluconolactonase n=1 Tax=Leptospira idonii TaxID=1193500 RepID=A0A4R9LY50_9LEPT|nr:6-phosphogluconolactonase [Leptospira idonii]TGN18267.1 6-phosphogluconolactonase [Leptospira idonii]
MKIHTFLNEEEFLSNCIARIESISKAKLEEKQSFHIVLTGGDTAKLIYSRLRSLHTDWSKWYFYFGDERCVPENHPDLNSLMAKETLLDHIPIKKQQVFIMPSYLGPKKGALEYSKIIDFSVPLDLILLGLGEDGHVASLFPGKDHPADQSVVPVFDSPKLPKERISLSKERINSSDFILLIAKGKKKEEVVQNIKEGKPLPVTSLSPKKALELYYLAI